MIFLDINMFSNVHARPVSNNKMVISKESVQNFKGNDILS